MIYYIYKITCLENNKIYIGKKISVKIDDGYFGSGKLLKRAIIKYGKEKFKKEIIEEVSKDLLSDREIYWIKFYKSTDIKIGYNISNGGDGGDTFTNNPNKEEIRLKVINSKKPENEEQKKLRSDALKKRWEDPEYKERTLKSIKKTLSGDKNKELQSKNSKEKWSNHEFRKSQEELRNSVEFKEKLSLAVKNQKRYECDFCSKVVTMSNLVRWHNNNCKNKVV